jgi:hypothetical protein
MSGLERNAAARALRRNAQRLLAAAGALGVGHANSDPAGGELPRGLGQGSISEANGVNLHPITGDGQQRRVSGRLSE